LRGENTRESTGLCKIGIQSFVGLTFCLILGKRGDQSGAVRGRTGLDVDVIVVFMSREEKLLSGNVGGNIFIGVVTGAVHKAASFL